MMEQMLANKQLVDELAQAAQNDGLTLPWCLRHLSDKFAQNHRRFGYLQQEDEVAAVGQRLDNEALALVLYAVAKAYPAGHDMTVEQ